MLSPILIVQLRSAHIEMVRSWSQLTPFTAKRNGGERLNMKIQSIKADDLLFSNFKRLDMAQLAIKKHASLKHKR